MLRTNSRKNSVIGIIIASVCILVYLGALVSVVIRISASMQNRRIDANREIDDLTDIASSAGVISFMDEDFIRIIQNAFERTRTLEGVIISVDQNTMRYGFEKEYGKAIIWQGNWPREFRNRFDFSRQPLYRPLSIQGLRNVNIEARAVAFDYAELTVIFREAMIWIFAALALAFCTLIIESRRKEQGVRGRADAPDAARPAAPGSAGKKGPQGPASAISYSQRGRVVKQENTETRLTEELHRCVSAGHDLAFIAMEFKPAAEESFYARFAADAARFFSSRDFICEKGERGISVICPGLNLDTGFLNANEFHSRVIGKYPGIFKSKTDLCMGISARSGRPINAERLMFEADEALERAMMDPVSHIVAFKSDPDKYRAFMESRGLNT